MEQKIIEETINQINKNISMPVYISDIHFSLLKKFPQATLQLKNVTLLSAKEFSKLHFSEEKNDTLLWIEDLYLSLNMLALMQHRVELSKISIKNGFVNILVDEKGRPNYAILKQVKFESDTADNSFRFMLKQISFNQLNVRYENLFKITSANWYFPNYQLKGEFYKTNYMMSTKGKILLKQFQIQQNIIKPAYPAEMQLNMQIANNQITFEPSFIKLDGQQIHLSGSVKLEPNLYLNISIFSDNLLLSKLNKLPFIHQSAFVDAEGHLAFKALVKGILNEKKSPQIMANFALAKGSIKTEFIQIKNGLTLDGSFSNGDEQNAKTSTLTISNFSASHKNSHIKGNLSLTNFASPFLSLNASLRINLMDASSYIKNNSINNLSGNLSGSIQSKGNISFEKEKWPTWFTGMEHEGTIELNAIAFDNKFLNLTIDQSQLRINNQHFNFENTKGIIQQTPFTGNISTRYSLDALLNKTRPLSVKATLETGPIDYKNFEAWFSADTSQTIDENTLQVDVESSIKAVRFTYNHLIANSLETSITYTKNKILINSLTFNAFGGTASAWAVYSSGNNQKSTLTVEGVLKKVDIKDLFTTFDNFDQKTLTNENIEGKLTSNFQFEGTFENKKLNPKSIDYLGHVRIDNGKLINFKPITEVSKFVEIDALNHIEFSTLENDLLISNAVIYIPKMEISSNAFDISIAGQQSFLGDYTYHVQLYLSDFLSGKSKYLQKHQSEFGPIEDDGYGRSRVFLLAESKKGKSDVRLDKSAIRQELKKGVSEEKTTLKKIFKDEFGWFKKDTLQKKETKKTKSEFVIEWDEE